MASKGAAIVSGSPAERRVAVSARTSGKKVGDVSALTSGQRVQATHPRPGGAHLQLLRGGSLVGSIVVGLFVLLDLLDGALTANR
jgi:hypothetical protein